MGQSLKTNFSPTNEGTVLLALCEGCVFFKKQYSQLLTKYGPKNILSIISDFREIVSFVKLVTLCLRNEYIFQKQTKYPFVKQTSTIDQRMQFDDEVQYC